MGKKSVLVDMYGDKKTLGAGTTTQVQKEVKNPMENYLQPGTATMKAAAKAEAMPQAPGSAVIDTSKMSPQDLVNNGTLPTLDAYTPEKNPVASGALKPYEVQSPTTAAKDAAVVEEAKQAAAPAKDAAGMGTLLDYAQYANTQFQDTFKQFYGYDWTPDMGFPLQKAEGMTDSDLAMLQYLYQDYLAGKSEAERTEAAMRERAQARDESAQRAYINYEKLKKYLPTQIKRAGMTGNLGATESAYLDAAAAYGNERAGIESAAARDISDLERAYGENATQRQIALAGKLTDLQREENAKIEAENKEKMQTNAAYLEDIIMSGTFNTGADLLAIIEGYEGKVDDATYDWAMKTYEAYVANPENVAADNAFTEAQKAEENKTTTAKEDEDALAGKTSFPATDQFGNEYKIVINGQALDVSEVNGSKLSKWVIEGLGYDSPYSKEIPNGTAVHPRLDRWYVYYNGEWYPGRSV